MAHVLQYSSVKADIRRTLSTNGVSEMNKLIGIAVLGFSAAALAQSAVPFEDVDANGDGVISQEEAAAIEGLDMATADTNQDGVLDRAEYEAATAQE
jgi:hypothetical protein